MKLKVTLAQFYPKLGNIEENIKRHLEIINKKKSITQLLIFPELSLTGYNLMDLTLDVAQRKDSHSLLPLLKASKDIGIIVGLVELGNDGFLYNSAFYYYGGTLSHIYHRMSSSYTIDTIFGKIGLIICEDALDPTVMSLLTQDGVKILIILSNSISYGFNPDQGIPKSASIWHTLTSIYAQVYSCYVIYVNRVGFEDGLNFWGGSHIVNPRGEIVIQCPYYDEAILDVELDLDLIQVARVTDPYLREKIQRLGDVR
ncbi:MAG: nitrilase-related carbon-nitrogen hydrolase [bacterium]